MSESTYKPWRAVSSVASMSWLKLTFLASGGLGAATETAADAGGGDERGDAARHVHRAAAGEVDHAAVAEEARARAPGRELARAPHHVDDGRVDEAREDDRVERVGEERGSFSNST